MVIHSAFPLQQVNTLGGKKNPLTGTMNNSITDCYQDITQYNTFQQAKNAQLQNDSIVF